MVKSRLFTINNAYKRNKTIKVRPKFNSEVIFLITTQLQTKLNVPCRAISGHAGMLEISPASIDLD